MADVYSTLTRLLTSLRAADPTWDISVGTATYKIMESVAQELSNIANNSTLVSYGLSVDSKTGTELDAFVNFFGISRQQGTRATGSATFAINAATTYDIQIPLGTQVVAPSLIGQGNIPFTTTSPAILSAGTTSIEVPVIATLPGSIGNVKADSIVQLSTPLVGITSVTNEKDFNNGVDPETDSQLKQRFVNTAFSNFAGTNGKFNSIARQLPTTTRVNVVSSTQNYSESLQVYTNIVGSGNFTLNLNTLAALTATSSGSSTASLSLGKLPLNYAVTVTSSTPSILPGGTTVTYDGTNYNLSNNTTGSGTIYVNYSVNSGTTLNGATTAATVLSIVSGLLNTVNLTDVVVTTTGATVSGGVGVVFNQTTPWNVTITTTGSTTASGTLYSQIPDSKFSYPTGGEIVGISLGTASEKIFVNNTDYYYIQATGIAPLQLKISLIPNYTNAPYSFTGQIVQLVSQYIPISSRVTLSGMSGSSVVSGTNVGNSSYVDIFIDDTTTNSVSEQIIMNTSSTFAATGTYATSNFITASGGSPTVGDYYINLAQSPAANFPYQINVGTAPSYMTFGIYNYPIALTRQSMTPIASCVGTSGNNYVTTVTTITGLQVGLVASGSVLGSGNYITGLVPGTPNIIKLANNLTGSVSSTVNWFSVAYPVYDNTTNAGSILDIAGIALISGSTTTTNTYGTDYPTNIPYQAGTVLHDYYSSVTTIDNLAQQSRVLGTNVLVHEASYLPLTINLSLVYDTNSTIPSVNSNIKNNITQYLNSVPFGSTVSFGGILQAVYKTNGVGAARITSSSEGVANYGIQIVWPNGSIRSTNTKDILLNSNQIPSLYNINYKTYNYNNF
jgi:uncharacterized phage protein gp47/JayE